MLLFQDIDLTGDSYILYTQGYDQNYYAITAEQAEDGIRCTAAQVEIVNGDSGTVRSVGDTDPVYWSFDKQGAVKSNIFTTLQTEEGEEQTVYLFADNKTQTLTTSDDVKGFNISVRNEGDYGEGNLYRFVGSQSRKAPVYEGGSFSISGTIDILNAWFRLAKLFVDEGIEAAQESAAVQEPEAVTEPAVVEEPEVVEEPVAAEEPALAEEPEVVEEPVAVEEPEVIEEPVAAQEPEVVEEPVAVEEPVVAQKPMVAEEPAVPARPVAEGKSRRSVKTASAAASIAAQTDDDLMDIEEETVPLAAFFREELPREELDEMTVEAAPAAASIAAQESTDLNDDLMDIEEEDVPLAASLPEELPSQAAPEEELPRMVVEAAPLAASFSEIDSDPAPVSGSVFSGIDLVELVMTALLAIVILLAGKQSMPVTLLGLGLAAMAVVVFFATEDLTGIICWTAVPSWQLTGLFALELMLTFWTLGNKLVSFGRVQIA